MKIVKASNGKTRLTLSKKEWQEIGRTAGWMKVAQSISLRDNATRESVEVYVNRSKEPHFIIDGCDASQIDLGKVKEYVANVDWADKASPAWITPRLRCDDFLKEEVEEVGMKEQMMNYLKSLYGSEDEWKNEAEVAIYYFARDYHGGQWSDLYSVLSTSPYKPGPISTMESEGDMVKMMYEDLVSEFS